MKDIMTDKFSWNVQLAGYEYTKYDEKGETNFDSFILEFEKFPWIDQIETYNKIQKGCSPTLSIKDHKTGTDFWVSMSGDKNDHRFLLGYVYPKIIKGFFGLGKPKEVRWLEIYLTKDTDIVKNCFKMYLNRETNDLISTIKKLDKFQEMEAQN